MSRSLFPHRGRRAAAALAVVTALVALPVTAAVAASDPDPSPTATEPSPDDSATPTDDPTLYVPEPTIDVSVHQPICDGDVPYLQYQVDVTGTPNDTVAITWINPDGADVVQSGLPLSGRVLWPGAEVDAQGKPVDWPGWRLVDGQWVVGDEYDWVRQPTQVQFAVNPTETVTVSYPPSSPNCSTNPPGTPTPDMKVRTLTPVCVDGVAYLDYQLEVTGTPNNTATLTWRNPSGGADVVQNGMPLAGRTLWPGAYPERNVTLPADQGWQLVNNMWMNTGQYPWAVGTLSLTFAVNPERTVQVTYPPAGRCFTASETPPPTPLPRADAASAADARTGSLASTGAQVALASALTIGLLAVGVVILVAARRSRASHGRTPHDAE